MVSAPSPSTTPLRKLLESHLSQLSAEAEKLFAETRENARQEFADQLNQAVRLLRIAPDAEEISATLLDAAAQFCSRAALFHIAGEVAQAKRVRGVAESVADVFPGTEISLSAAAALAGAVATRDPVTAATTPAEVSFPLWELFDHTGDGRASIYPVVVKDRVRALVYAWGEVQGPAIELLTQVAAAVWSAIPEPVAPSELIAIAPAPTAASAESAQEPTTIWQSLSAEEQQVHLRAQRFARVQVAEMRLFEAESVQVGRNQGSLYETLRKSIDAARETFRKRFFSSCASMVDYLDLELARTLANDDRTLLGETYPGPLVP